MAASALKRKITYSVDQYSMSQTVIPQLAARIESGVAPLAQGRGLTVKRERKSYKMGSGHTVPGLYNLEWKARNGMRPGFTVSVAHNKSNYLTVDVKAAPFYPIAVAIAVVLGSVITYFYLQWLLADFWRNILFPPIIAGMIIVFFLCLIYVIRSLIISGIVALASTFTFGFIAAAALGWVIGAALADTKHGTSLRPGLMEIMARLDTPVQLGYAAAYPPPAAPPYGAYAANPYAPTTAARPPPVYAPPPPAPGPPRVHPPAPLGPPRYAPPPGPPLAGPTAAAATAPCPTCQTPLPLRTPKCPNCGLEMVWD